MSDPRMVNQLVQSQLWGRFNPEGARQVEQAMESLTAYNDHVIEAYKEAFKRKAQKEAQKKEAQKKAILALSESKEMSGSIPQVRRERTPIEAGAIYGLPFTPSPNYNPHHDFSNTIWQMTMDEQ
jgi:hypothetical protein